MECHHLHEEMDTELSLVASCKMDTFSDLHLGPNLTGRRKGWLVQRYVDYLPSTMAVVERARWSLCRESDQRQFAYHITVYQPTFMERNAGDTAS